MEEPSEDEKINIIRFSKEIQLKTILFFVALIAFIAITGVFLYMALYKYEWQLVTAVGASDGFIGLVIGQITRSLFRTKE
ncbi:hypothetical protein [Maribacter sp. LLG6340-A2]|uniref:hypothetical protein n=1 Tax=Maribacter sp. LLG6340-A2 TaxID=3160834 RepID=UPI0038653577